MPVTNNLPRPNAPNNLFASYFTVYKTEKAIEIHSGCEDYEQVRVICTCLDYQQACEIARLVSNLHHLPVINSVEQL
jgi:hypothetical protein